MAALAITPQLEFADGIEAISKTLDSHPREQIGTVSEFDWTVLQQAGNIKGDIWREVAKRYKEQSLPVAKNAVEDREVDQVLLAMGKADDAFSATKVLGKYASKFKRAKDALMNAVPNLSLGEARTVIVDVMFGEGAGIALQVAALRLIMELQVPNPLELYKLAWKNGLCHRDVAANILSKMATTTCESWSPDDVRYMFGMFEREPLESENPQRASRASREECQAPAGKKYPPGAFSAMSAGKKENLNYIAQLVLVHLRSNRKWGLPFLPEVLGKLALIPGNTDSALGALLACEGMETEILKVLTEISIQARLASKAAVGSAAASRPEAQLLSALSSYGPGNDSIVTHAHSNMDLYKCDPTTLRCFIDECLAQHTALIKWPRAQSSRERLQALTNTLKVWLFALKPSDAVKEWQRVLADMESVVRARGGIDELGMMIETVTKHITSMPDLNHNHARMSAMIPVCRELFERVLKDIPEPLSNEELSRVDWDSARHSQHSSGVELRWKIIGTHWTDLIAHGCDEDEVCRLTVNFCPAGKKESLVTNIVNSVVKLSSNQSKLPVEMHKASIGVAHVALRWLAEGTEDAFLSLLANLWPRVLVGSSAGNALSTVLEFYSKFPQNTACIHFVKAYAVDRSPKPPKQLRRTAMQWLSSLLPRDAVRMWPDALFDKENATDPGASEGDVTQLLDLCDKHSLDLPDFPVKVSVGVIRILSTSHLAQARLSAVRALQELDLKKVDRAQAPLLSALRSDGSTIVTASARLAWRAFFKDRDIAASSTGGDSPPGELIVDE